MLNFTSFAGGFFWEYSSSLKFSFFSFGSLKQQERSMTCPKSFRLFVSKMFPISPSTTLFLAPYGLNPDMRVFAPATPLWQASQVGSWSKSGAPPPSSPPSPPSPSSPISWRCRALLSPSCWHTAATTASLDQWEAQPANPPMGGGATCIVPPCILLPLLHPTQTQVLLGAR